MDFKKFSIMAEEIFEVVKQYFWAGVFVGASTFTFATVSQKLYTFKIYE